MVKSFFQRLCSKAVRQEIIWKLLDSTVLKATRLLESARRRFEVERRSDELARTNMQILGEVCPDLVVKHGPFAGMKYPGCQSFGSALVPKILGSYESEIHPIIESICSEPYTEIIDIGCGEGYYAVGLALRIPTAVVYAYDTNAAACRFCGEMAALNGVGDRVIAGSFCDEAVLRSIPVSRRCLIISDCEGYEKTLFSADLVRSLVNYDLLIETHDFIDIAISDDLVRLFQSSHEIKTIKSIDDIEKAKTYRFKEIAHYDFGVRKRLLGERRPTIMEWLFLRSRQTMAKAS
jgi:hypothetical protein